MMYSELIKWLRECASGECFNCSKKGNASCPDDLMKQAADAIEELQKQLQKSEVDNINLTGWLAEEHAKLDRAEIENIKLKEEFAKYRGKHRWIPVTERLPERKWSPYLCLIDSGRCCEVRWTNNIFGYGKPSGEWGWSNADVPQYCKVTHWMPLPEPLESEGE